ncbi:MAG: hypothetical protein JKY99_04610 [Rhizobiales bacterium]|nr:hypothetical protein [Hyphomicrobiales bacterium]
MDMYSLGEELALRRRLLFRIHHEQGRRELEETQTRRSRIKRETEKADAALFGEVLIRGADSFDFK